MTNVRIFNVLSSMPAPLRAGYERKAGSIDAHMHTLREHVHGEAGIFNQMLFVSGWMFIALSLLGWLFGWHDECGKKIFLTCGAVFVFSGVYLDQHFKGLFFFHPLEKVAKALCVLRNDGIFWEKTLHGKSNKDFVYSHAASVAIQVQMVRASAAGASLPFGPFVMLPFHRRKFENLRRALSVFGLTWGPKR